jgi:pimeloyl-ACP methyl ester carboxylesterase
MKHILYRKKNIFFTDEGHGRVIVLLHGYMESSRMWKEFTPVLRTAYRVIAIDLPGHGKSGSLAPVHDMDLVAQCVHKVLTDLKITKCLMIGHSMGGYVTLAFSQRYPAMLKGFGLFHSHIFPDDEETKKNRDRNIAIIRKNKMSFITKFFPSLFSEETRHKFKKEIEKMVARAGKMSPEAVIASQEGMKIRPDRSEVLRSASVPVLFILGMKDPKVPVERYWEMLSLPKHSEALLMKDVAHMGFLEDPLATVKAVYFFARKVL